MTADSSSVGGATPPDQPSAEPELAEADGGPEPSADAAAGPEAASPEATSPETAAEANPEGGEAGEPDLAARLAVVEGERDEYLRTLQHLQADFENYRKRIQRQQSETLDRAGEDLVVKLLVVLDNADLALAHISDPAVREPLEQLAASLIQVLAKEGLEKIEPEGAGFDPNEHEAVMHESGEGEPVVTAVLRAGYRYRGRLIRPALVKVSG